MLSYTARRAFSFSPPVLEAFALLKGILLNTFYCTTGADRCQALSEKTWPIL